MAKLKFRDENNEFIPVVQDVKVNGRSVFDGKEANIEIPEPIPPDVNKEYVDTQINNVNQRIDTIDEEKQDVLVGEGENQNIKTVNNQSILGSGNIDVSTEAVYIPMGIIYYNSKMGDEAFIEAIGGLDHLEEIKDAARNRKPLVIGNGVQDYCTVIDVYINENMAEPYFFEMVLNFYYNDRYNQLDNTIYTITISGRETSNFNVETTHLLSLLGQISLFHYWDLEYRTNMPIGTSAYVISSENYGTKGFVDFAIGEMIDTVRPNAYPINYGDEYLQSIPPEDLTSEAILTQGENELIVSFRPDPKYNTRNIFDWHIIKRSMGQIVSNLHYVYINTNMGDFIYGWNVYDEIADTIESFDFYVHADEFLKLRHYIKSSFTPATYSNYDVSSFIETSEVVENGLYRYIEVLDPSMGITETKWVHEYPNVQPDLAQQDSLAPDYIKNKELIPQQLSDLSDDNTHRLVTDTEKSTWNNKQEELVSGTNIKTINNQSLLGSGNITIQGGGSSTDIQINGTSIVNNDVANIVTKTAYDASTNKIATENDLPDISGKQDIIDSSNKLSANYISGLANVAISGSYSDLSNTPTNVSSFTNDAGYLTLATLPIYNGGVQ